ncbi:MAG: hypothetical protein ACTSU5_22145 [Promethearchaeota archaeon]
MKERTALAGARDGGPLDDASREREDKIRVSVAVGILHALGLMPFRVFLKYSKLVEETSTFTGGELDGLQAAFDEFTKLEGADEDPGD